MTKLERRKLLPTLGSFVAPIANFPREEEVSWYRVMYEMAQKLLK
jgi:hypothetical protein